MQKFTRPLTREVELGGARLAFTFSEKGISVRPVGSRRPPREITWAALLAHLASAENAPEPTAEALATALDAIKSGAASGPASMPAAVAHAAVRKPEASNGGQARGSDPLARLETWLAAHRPRYLHSLAPGASAAELQSLESSVGVPLPGDLRALLAWHNGQRSGAFAGHFEQDWDLMSTTEIAEAKRHLDAGGPTAAGWQRGWIPFASDDADDYLCVDTTQTTAPVRAFWQGKTDHPVIAVSLQAWLADFVAAVERGGYAEDPERGSFLRRGG